MATKTATILHRVAGEGDPYLADTPGLRALWLQGVDLNHLDELFPECAPDPVQWG